MHTKGGYSTVSHLPDEINTAAKEVFHESLDYIADDLCCVVRLLNKPEACMSAPEVMDAIRLAGNDLARRTRELACRMRQEAKAVVS